MSLFNFSDENQTKEESRRTIIAVILSTVIVAAGFMIQEKLFPAPRPSAQTTQSGQSTQQAGQSSTVSSIAIVPEAAPAAPAAAGGQAAEAAGTAAAQAPEAIESYTVETDLLRAELSNQGGDIVSLKLKGHKDKNDSVDLIIPGQSGPQGMSLGFGGREARPVKDLMSAVWLDSAHTTLQFSRTYYAKNASGGTDPFILKKTFTFREGEYMFGLAVTLESLNGAPLSLGADGAAYTLQIGPQIGPRFDNLAKKADYRKYIMEIGGKKKVEMPRPNTVQVPKDQPSWASIVGKYFAFIAVPQAPFADFSFVQGQDPLIQQTNTMYLTRHPIQSSSQTDTYYFYFGPKTSTELSRYEYADKNSFGLSALKLEDATERSNMLGWLETILKFLLNMAYKIIPNYGVAIILVTILIKALFYPLTKKSSVSTARMQELQPKIQELQTKYKTNQQKLNEELAALYKQENYNPMSGCLPMLIQFPLFIAMYNLFNNHFDLRGASFIPGWIGDLSLPETIWNFGAFRIPLLGWNDLRGLPIIYLLSQLFYGKFTQAPQSGQNAGQMKLMMYGMPIMFFFVLYDVPSGLLIYWIVNNIITIIQQVVINNMLKKRKLAIVAGGPATAAAGAGQAKSAGKTTVKSAAPKKQGMNERLNEWLEKKTKEMEQAGGARAGKSAGAAKGKAESGAKKGKASKR